MKRGEPDIAPELWINAVREPLKVALDEGRLHSANDGPISGLGEGWWVPPYVVENHPSSRRCWTCSSGPTCSRTRRILPRARSWGVRPAGAAS